MVAIAVILSVLVGIASLVTTTVRGQRLSEEVVIATNLAREGLEMARAFRDNGFTAGLRSGGCTSNCATLRDTLGDHEAIPQLVDVTAPFKVNLVLNYEGVDNTFGGKGVELCLRSNPPYYYQQFNNTNSGQSCAQAGGTLTRFKRWLVVDYVCLNPGTQGECVETNPKICGQAGGSCDPSFSQFAGHRVQSHVRITGRQGPNRDVVAEEYLYAWK